MISARHKCIMVHIPRTGGMSRRVAINGKACGHLSAAEYIERFGLKKWANHYTFAFIRNPWERYVSMYTWMKKKGAHRTRKFSFDMWLRKKIQDYPHLATPQWDMVTVNDEIVVDDVFRFEHFEKDWARCVHRINDHAETSYGGRARADTLVKALPHYGNATMYPDHRMWYNDALKERVAAVECKIIEYGGYTF